MKVLVSLIALLISALPTLNAAASRGEAKEPKRVLLSDLANLATGDEVIVRFKVRSTHWLSGGVPKGQARSFRIEPVTGPNDGRISVLVVGELADAMERFGFSPPNPGDRLAGATIEAQGRVRVYPAPVKAPEKGPSCQLRIGNLKGFRIVTR